MYTEVFNLSSVNIKKSEIIGRKTLMLKHQIELSKKYINKNKIEDKVQKFPKDSFFFFCSLNQTN